VEIKLTMNLLYLLGVPLITSVALLFARNVKSVKLISLIGSTIQFALAFFLVYAFRQERILGNAEDMLFQKSRIQFDWTKEKLTVKNFRLVFLLMTPQLIVPAN